MAKKIKYWNNTCERFVVFLDIMGFRDRVFRGSHGDVKKMLESLHPAIESIEKLAINMDQYITIKTHEDDHSLKISAVFPVSFSDSIILISNEASIFSAFKIFTNARSILSKAIDEGIPMKGAIAYGEMTADLDNSLYFGRPLIDAYELQKELQLYSVVLHHTMEKRLTDIQGISPFEKYGLICKYPVPMKSGKINHYVVDWTFLSEKEKDPLDSINMLYNYVSGSPRLYVDNTIEFVRWVTEKKAELAQKKKSSKGSAAARRVHPGSTEVTTK
jgi:hypothetical protein